MKVLSVFLLVSLSAAWSQTPPPAPGALPDLPDKEVIAELPDGYKMTMGEFKQIYAAIPPNMQQMAVQDRTKFLNEYSLLRTLTRIAEENKLDQESPYKEAVYFSRIMVLGQAQMLELSKSTTVNPAEIVKYYDSNKDKYRQVKVKGIYISFSKSGAADASGKKYLTEDEAKGKAARLVKDARSGANFVKLVKENSEDAVSRDKDGDFYTLRGNDNIPEAIRTAVFALKQGEISDPVWQPNGFYIFRAEEVNVRPLSDVRDEIYSMLKDEHYRQAMDKINADSKVKSFNPAFLGNAPVRQGSAR